MIAYLKDNFPKEATNENDLIVTDYFYDIVPAVLWLQDDGTYYGS